MVKIVEDPVRVHAEHFERITSIVNNKYTSMPISSSELLLIYDSKICVGSLTLEKNNLYIIMEGNPSNLSDLANELEQAGYQVTIID